MPAQQLALPVVGTPIAQVFDDLVKRADAGDRRAACRLAADLANCAWASRQTHAWGRMDDATRRAAREMQSMDAASEAEDAQKQSMSIRLALDERVGKSAHLCEGLTAENQDRAFEFQLRAAELGHPGAAVDLALNPALDPGEFRRHLREWSNWQERAPQILDQALAHGDARAALTLATWYSQPSDSMPVRVGEGPVAPDATRAALYFELVDRTAAPDLRQWLSMHRKDPRADMTAAERHRITLRAKAMLPAFKNKPELETSPWHVDNPMLSGEDCEQ